MTITKAQQKAVAKYESKVYDKTLIRMPKGKLIITKSHRTWRDAQRLHKQSHNRNHSEG